MQPRPDDAIPAAAPLEGFESMAETDMDELVRIIEEWNDKLTDEGIDTAAVMRAAQTIRQRATEWLYRDAA